MQPVLTSLKGLGHDPGGYCNLTVITLDHLHAIIDSGRLVMAQLLVRGIENQVILALKLRAARNGRSAEAEHREILSSALLPESNVKSLKDHLLEMPDVGLDADFERQQDTGRELDL